MPCVCARVFACAGECADAMLGLDAHPLVCRFGNVTFYEDDTPAHTRNDTHDWFNNVIYALPRPQCFAAVQSTVDRTDHVNSHAAVYDWSPRPLLCVRPTSVLLVQCAHVWWWCVCLPDSIWCESSWRCAAKRTVQKSNFRPLLRLAAVAVGQLVRGPRIA
jgi:hypothetical protein